MAQQVAWSVALALLLAFMAGCVDAPPRPDGGDGSDGSDGSDGADGGDASNGGDGTDGGDDGDGADGADGSDGGDGSAQDPLTGALTASRDGDDPRRVTLTWNVTANWPGIEALDVGFAFSRPVEIEGDATAGPVPLAPGETTSNAVTVVLPDDDTTFLVRAWAAAPVFQASRVGASNVREVTWEGGVVSFQPATWPAQSRSTLEARFQPSEDGAPATVLVTMDTAVNAPDSRLYVRAVSGGADLRLVHPDTVEDGRVLAWSGEVVTAGTSVSIGLAFTGSGQAQVAMNFMPDPAVDLAQYGHQLVFDVENGTATLRNGAAPASSGDDGQTPEPEASTNSSTNDSGTEPAGPEP